MTMLLKTARSTLGNFVARASDSLIATHGLTVEQAKGLKNALSDGVRMGGAKTRGFYQDLPSGDGATTEVTDAQYSAATATARSTLNVLLVLMAGAGEIPGQYSHGAKAKKGDTPAIKGQIATVVIDTSDFEAFSDSELDTFLANAAGGASRNSALAGLDF